MTQNSDQFKTIYELKDIIKRCLNECEQAGYIATVNKKIIVDEDMVAEHISKTIIGELLELEILRKLSPIFRTLDSIKVNMKFLDEKQAIDAGISNLRIGQK
jgi:hypothetical protein